MLNYYNEVCNEFAERVSASLRLSQRWNRSGFSRPDPTGKFQNHRRLTDRSTGRLTGFCLARSTGFLQKVFLHYSMFLIKNFQKGGEWMKC